LRKGFSDAFEDESRAVEPFEEIKETQREEIGGTDSDGVKLRRLDRIEISREEDSFDSSQQASDSRFGEPDEGNFEAQKETEPH